MRPPPFSAASQAAVGAAMDRWDAILETSDELDVLRVELTKVVDLIDGFPAVRRALTDPSRSGEDKAQFATDLLEDTFHPDIVDLVAGMSRSRWSREADITRALERIHGVTAVALAERRGELDRVGDAHRDPLQGAEARLPLEHEQRERHLQREPDAEGAPVDAAAVPRERDRDREDDDDAEKALKAFHVSSPGQRGRSRGGGSARTGTSAGPSRPRRSRVRSRIR